MRHILCKQHIPLIGLSGCGLILSFDNKIFVACRKAFKHSKLIKIHLIPDLAYHSFILIL